MSFIKYKDKIFSKNRYNTKKRYVGQLRNVTSCSDIRAWCTIPEIQRQYMLDSFSGVSDTNSEYKGISTKCVQVIKRKRKTYKKEKYTTLKKENGINGNLCKKIYCMSTHSSSQSQELNVANICHHGQHHEINVENEVDNLRNLVKDLRDQVIYLEEFKKENNNLRIQLNGDINRELAEAKEEIYYLKRNIEIYGEIEKRYETLQVENQTIRDQTNEASKQIKELDMERLKLIDELKKKKYEMNEINSRSLVVSNAIVDKEILQDRIQVKDDKINFLLDIVENQEFTIHDLNLEIQNLKANYNYKEEKLLQNLGELKLMLNHETNKGEKLEKQLLATEELVKELENLRDELRSTNLQIAENLYTYKRQFNTIRTAGEHMLVVIKQLKETIVENEMKIKKLSIYPQNGMCVVYFAHLDYVLNSTERLRGDTDQLDYVLSYMRQILRQIKQEMWGSKNLPITLEINNNSVQTEMPTLMEIGIQFDRMKTENYVQTLIPDEYIVKYNQAQVLIKKLSIYVENLEQTITNRDGEINNLEKKLIGCIEEKAMKICQLERLKEQNKSLQKELVKRNQILEYSDNLLSKSVNDLNSEKVLKGFTNSMVTSALDRTFSEYTSYISLLETFIDYNEKNINIIYNFVVAEMNSENENIKGINDELLNLQKELIDDKCLSQDLFTRIINLREIVNENNIYLDTLKNKLLMAELTIAELSSASSMTSKESMAAVVDIGVQVYVDTGETILMKKLSYNKKKMQKIVRYYKGQKQELKNKILNLQMNMKRVNIFISDFQKRWKDIMELVGEFKEIGNEIAFENDGLRGENIDLVVNMEACGEKIVVLEKQMENLLIQNDESQLIELEMKDENLNLTKKLHEYKKMIVRGKKKINEINDKFVLQEKEFENNVEKLMKKNNENLDVILKLERQIYLLKDLQDAEEKMRVNKIFVENGIQTDIKEEVNKAEMMRMKEHYDCVIETLEKEFTIRYDKNEKQHLNNIKSIKDAYENDMQLLKITHNENISRIQSLHEEELAILNEVKKEKIYTDSATAVNFSQIEIETLKENYMSKLMEKEEIFLNKIEEIKLQENDRLIKEKEIELMMIQIDLEKQVDKFKKKFIKEKKNMKLSYKNKVESLQKCYRKLFEKEVIKLSSMNKLKTVDEQTQSDQMPPSWFADEYCNIPVKESSLETSINSKEQELESSLKTSKNTIEQELNGNIVTLAAESDIGDLKTKGTEIKENESLCSKYNEVDIIPIQYKMAGDGSSHLNDRTLKGYDFLLQRIAKLENELYLRNLEIRKNAILYEKKMKEEQMKNKELGTILNEEMDHGNDIQCRLGLEYNRAEQLLLEKEESKFRCAQLEIRLQETEDMLINEKARTSALMNEIEKLSTKGEYTDQLELSLLRLKHKLDQAIDCEKRLTLELRKEMQHKKKIEAILRINEITEEHSSHVSNKNSITKSDSDLKVIFIQQCGILHTWSKQIPY